MPLANSLNHDRAEYKVGMERRGGLGECTRPAVFFETQQMRGRGAPDGSSSGCSEPNVRRTVTGLRPFG